MAAVPAAAASAGPASAQAAPAIPAVNAKPEAKAAPVADPLGDLAKARSSATGADPFSYFVQVGAYRTADDAESQRAKLSLGGVEARVSEREQSGRTVYRVRLGPFDRKSDAEAARERLTAGGVEAQLVRVQR